jgi:hypothetical protein
MDRESLVLLLASDSLAPEQEREPLDSIRVQKAIFLLEEDGPPGWRDLFEFIAWNWGPFSKELAAEVDRLVARGLLEPKPIPFRQYPAFKTTPQGEHLVQALLGTLPDEELGYIRRVRQYVTSRSFNQLLREIYAAHPDYAERSQFQY